MRSLPGTLLCTLASSQMLIIMLIGSGLLKQFQELPLNDIQGIIVQDSAIYIGLGEYGRIQQYNLDGTFVNSWSAWTITYEKARRRSTPRRFNFTINSKGEPEVLSIFPRQGLDYLKKELGESVIEKIPAYRMVDKPYEFVSNLGIIYRYKHGQLVRIDGEKREVILRESVFQRLYPRLSVWGLIGFLGAFLWLGPARVNEFAKVFQGQRWNLSKKP